MHTIFAVEDDDNIRELLIYALESSGFDAQGFSDGAAFFSAIQTGNSFPVLLLLDIMLPGENGISILKKIKLSQKTKDIPVIMLTAKGSEYDRIKGLNLGADDYITKPFSVMEVIARIRAVLRRSASNDDDILSACGIILNDKKRSVFSDGEELALTFKEFELLRCLLRNKGIVLARDKILELVWSYAYSGETRTVDMHIKSLRQKLKDKGDLIKTIRNVGYKIEDE